ncbi:MAG TPA: hypothetical protein VLV48_05880, partial [Thermoanaerobaculia bacterium]|nr:hypothetical protein [Thermoanaerobaculia bacterium]
RSVISGVGGAVGDAAATSRMRLLINLAIPYDVAALVILGAVLLFAASRSDQTESAPARVYAILVIAFVVAFVALNPAAYVYNAVILVPLLAPLLGGIGRLTRRLPVADTAALALVALLTVTGGLHAMETVIERNSADQRNTLDWMWQNTAPEERAFDWQGMHFGRLGVHHWWTYRGMLGPYRAGAYRLEEEWRQAPVTLVLHTYRLQWLTRADSAFLRDHFVSIAPCASVPGYVVSGAELRGGSRFEIFAEGIYERRPGAAVLIDGRPAPRRLRLARGVHTIEAAPGITPPAVFGLRYRGARRRLPPCGDEPLLRPFILSSSRW